MKRSEFTDYVLNDLFESIDGITTHRMFSADAIFRYGLIIGMVIDDTLYFKTNAQTEREYENMGSKPFVYQGKKEEVKMPYWEVPADVMDNRETFREWAETAYGVALAAKKLKSAKK